MEKNKQAGIRIGKTIYTPSDMIFYFCIYLFFIIFAVVCIYPFYYMIINSISANDLSANGEVNFVPKQIHFQNYLEIFKLKGLPMATLISLGRTILGTLGTVLASAFLGFMFTQEKMMGRKVWYRMIVITMYFNAGLIPLYITMRNIGISNTFWIYVIPAIVQPFNIILVKTYIESLPASLQEAAEIDGAGVLRVFFQIVLPISTPILATIAIFAAVGQWNAFQDTLIYISNQKLYSLQYLLYTYLNQANSLATMIKNSGMANQNLAATAMQQTPTSIRMTISVIVVLPILFIYPLFQGYFVKGIMLGSVKG